MPNDLIATRRLVASRPGEAEFTITVGIGAPAPFAGDEWTCFVKLDGLFSGRAVHASDSWQALMLAQALARQLLTHFVEDGGTLRDSATNEPVDVTRLFAGGI